MESVEQPDSATADSKFTAVELDVCGKLSSSSSSVLGDTASTFSFPASSIIKLSLRLKAGWASDLIPCALSALLETVVEGDRSAGAESAGEMSIFGRTIRSPNVYYIDDNRCMLNCRTTLLQ